MVNEKCDFVLTDTYHITTQNGQTKKNQTRKKKEQLTSHPSNIGRRTPPASTKRGAHTARGGGPLIIKQLPSPSRNTNEVLHSASPADAP